MMLGHGLLAFALAAWIASRRGFDARQALAVGAVAGAFGTLPDADMLYALWGAASARTGDVLAVNEAFWDASHVAHRSATHSLVVAVPAGVAFALWARRPAVGDRLLAAGLLGGVVAAGYLASGALDAVMLAAFSSLGIGLASAVRRWTDLPWRVVLAATLLGLLSHPWGDLFTGAPPHLLYPLDVRLFAGRLSLVADPTVHLLGTFAFEVVAVWLAAAVCLGLVGRPIREYVDPQAALGAGYGVAALVLPAPTLEVPTAFVVSILGVGFVLAGTVLAVPPQFPRALSAPWRSRPGGTLLPVVGGDWNLRGALLTATLTGTAAVTAAWVGYLAVYLLA